LDRVRFARDGTRALAIATGSGGSRIVVIDRATLALRYVTPPERDISFGCWSPDGKWIAAEERVNGQTNLVVMSSEGGPVRPLVTEPVESWPHDWAPDSDRIVFAALRDGVWNVYWVSRSTGQVHQVTRYTSQSAFVRYPSWSPRGNQIVFEHNDLNANVFLAEVK
jgi:Tol biopolymer transport system component